MKAKTLADAIREAAKRDGRTAYALAQASGLPIPVISRFLSGQRDMYVASADKLCRALGLELRPARRRR
jgi:transcriptional regulator with XRE-family HTH domain